MERKTKTILSLFILALVLSGAYLLMRPAKPDELAKVHMLDVGQGDSFLIVSADDTQLLIDAGKDAKVLTELSRVMPRGDRSIDVVIATHPDADHIGGLASVFARYDVGLFLTSQVEADTETFRSLFETIDEKEIPAYYVRTGMNLSLGTAPATDFSILFPDRETIGWETNTASVVGRLQIGERSILFTGDSPESIEAHLVKNDPRAIDVDILKLGHHGSKTSSSEPFLRATTPALALVSAGADNRYGHPAPEVTARLAALKIPSISTIDTGTYTLKTDGVKWFKE